MDEVGDTARKLDNETTTLERMKLTRHSVIRIVIALTFYATTMLMFAVLL